MNRPEPLARALKGALAGLKLDQRLRESQVMALWPEIVGEVTASKTRPLHVNRGTLVVLVSSSAWAHQLSLLKPRLLASIEQRVGPGIIRDLRWKTGVAGDHAVEQSESAPSRRRLAAEQPALPQEELAAINRMASGVEDEKLAAGFERLLVAHARRKQRLKAAGWEACTRCGCLHDAKADAENHGPSKAPLCPVCRLELEPWLAPMGSVRDVTAPPGETR
jgi:hypothetical protein